MCPGKNQSKILDNGDDAASQHKGHKGSVSSPRSSEVRSSTGIDVTENGDGAGQRRDPNIFNPPKASPASGGSKTQNVVVLGPTGGGASSVINLIVGQDVAPVSNGAQRHTTATIAYPIELGRAGGTIHITIYDTPSFDSSPPSLPSGEIDLAIVCMEDRTPQVKEVICYLDNWAKSCNLPVLIVINHMTPSPSPNWWEMNKDHFAKLRLVAGHACLTRAERLKNSEELRSLIIKLLFRRA